MSTSILVKKMKNAATERQIDAEIWAISKAELATNKDKADVILLGPQIRYALNEVKLEVGDNKPVAVIDVMDYGMMNGSKVLDFALNSLEK
jgi:Phosphotransferase system cellobiose-specific component IIB